MKGDGNEATFFGRALEAGLFNAFEHFNYTIMTSEVGNQYSSLISYFCRLALPESRLSGQIVLYFVEAEEKSKLAFFQVGTVSELHDSHKVHFLILSTVFLVLRCTMVVRVS